MKRRLVKPDSEAEKNYITLHATWKMFRHETLAMKNT